MQYSGEKISGRGAVCVANWAGQEGRPGQPASAALPRETLAMQALYLAQEPPLVRAM